MPIMRRRKFITQKETRADNTNLLQVSQQEYFNDHSRITFKEPVNNDGLSFNKNKSNVSILHINKSTSTINEHNIDNPPDTLKKQSNKEDQKNKTDTETRPKRKSEWDKSAHVEKPFIHRIKVRNPKHRTFALGNKNKHKITVGTSTGIGREEIDSNLNDFKHFIDECVKEPQYENSCKAMCRICHGGDSTSEFGRLVSACSCRGTIGRVHVICLETWLTESGKSKCELCSTRYSIRRVHKYGILKALTIWLISQNSKQLMIDMLGTILMMPLAILAAWLSGTTFLNLMAQEDEMAAWPLVSSFMLSCTTLVCYYCWIVSAATRHAIGWWIWYQSQYEVKLQFITNTPATDEYTLDNV